MLIRSLAVATVLTATTFGLVGCDQIPSLDAEDQAANKSACESISATWETINSAMSSGDLLQLPTALAAIPSQVDGALAQVKDKQLTEALTDLKTKTQGVIAGGELDVTGLVSAGVGISARCAVLGSAIDLQIPSIGQ